jgi:hypothetical protein
MKEPKEEIIPYILTTCFFPTHIMPSFDMLSKVRA